MALDFSAFGEKNKTTGKFTMVDKVETLTLGGVTSGEAFGFPKQEQPVVAPIVQEPIEKKRSVFDIVKSQIEPTGYLGKETWKNVLGVGGVPSTLVETVKGIPGEVKKAFEPTGYLGKETLKYLPEAGKEVQKASRQAIEETFIPTQLINALDKVTGISKKVDELKWNIVKKIAPIKGETVEQVEKRRAEAIQQATAEQEAVAKIRTQYPIINMTGQFAGEIANLYTFSQIFAPVSATIAANITKAQVAAHPLITAFVTAYPSAALSFGSMNLLRETAIEIENKRFDPMKLTEEFSKGFAYGVGATYISTAVAGIRIPSPKIGYQPQALTSPQRIFGSALGGGALTTLEKLLVNKKITAEDVPEIAKSAALFAIFEAINGETTARIYQARLEANRATDIAFRTYGEDFVRTTSGLKAIAEEAGVRTGTFTSSYNKQRLRFSASLQSQVEQGLMTTKDAVTAINKFDQGVIASTLYDKISAYTQLRMDREYIIVAGEKGEPTVMIVNELTGRRMPGMQYEKFLQDAMQMKIGMVIEPGTKFPEWKEGMKPGQAVWNYQEVKFSDILTPEEKFLAEYANQNMGKDAPLARLFTEKNPAIRQEIVEKPDIVTEMEKKLDITFQPTTKTQAPAYKISPGKVVTPTATMISPKLLSVIPQQLQEPLAVFPEGSVTTFQHNVAEQIAHRYPDLGNKIKALDLGEISLNKAIDEVKEVIPQNLKNEPHIVEAIDTWQKEASLSGEHIRETQQISQGLDIASKLKNLETREEDIKKYGLSPFKNYTKGNVFKYNNKSWLITDATQNEFAAVPINRTDFDFSNMPYAEINLLLDASKTVFVLKEGKPVETSQKVSETLKAGGKAIAQPSKKLPVTPRFIQIEDTGGQLAPPSSEFVDNLKQVKGQKAVDIYLKSIGFKENIPSEKMAVSPRFIQIEETGGILRNPENDPEFIKFIEDLRQTKGQATVDAYLKSVGFRENLPSKEPIEAFKKERKAMDIYFGEVTYDITEAEGKKIIGKFFSEKEMEFLAQGGMIKTRGGVKRAYGKYANSLIEVVKKDGKVSSAVVYHEAFHGYIKKFVSEYERRKLLDIVKENNNIKTDVEAEERLADDFAEYIKTKKTFSEKVKFFFTRLINKIKSWIGKEDQILKTYDEMIAGKRPEVAVKEEMKVAFKKKAVKPEVIKPRVEKKLIREAMVSRTVPPKTVISRVTGIKPYPEKKITMKERQFVRRIIKAEVKAAKGGAEWARKVARAEILGQLRTTRTDTSDIRKQITDYVKQALDPKDRGKANVIIRDAKDQEDLVKAFVRIDRWAENAEKKTIRDDVISSVRKALESPAVAIDYKAKIKEVIDEFELKGHLGRTMEKLQATKKYIDERLAIGEDIEMPQRIWNSLRILTRKPYEELTISEMKGLQDEVKALDAIGRMKWATTQGIYDLEKSNIKDILIKGTTPMNRIDKISPKIGERLSPSQEFKNYAIGVANQANRVDKVITPMDALFDWLDGAKGTFSGANSRQIKNRIDRGWNLYQTLKDDIQDPIVEKAISLKMNDTNMERIGFVAAREQEGGLEKLKQLGYTEEEINAVQLTKDERDMLNLMRNAMEKEYPYVVDIMRKVYNQPVGRVKNYFSFMTDWSKTDEAEIYKRMGPAAEEFGLPTKTVEHGFTIPRRAMARQKIKLNAMSIFLRHTDNVAYLRALGRDIKMIFEIVNSDEYRTAAGDLGQLLVLEWLDLMARKGGSAGAKKIALIDTMRKNIGIGMIGLKLSSAAVQWTEVIPAFGFIGPGYGMKGIFNISTSKDWREFILKFPEVRNRAGGESAIQELIDGSTFRKLQAKGFIPLEKVDTWAASSTAAGAYEKKMAELGEEIDLSKEPNQEAMEYAQQIVRRNQGVAGYKDVPLAISRGALTGSTSFDRALFQFQNFVLFRWSRIRYEALKAGIEAKDPLKVAGILFWTMVGMIAAVGTKMGVNAISDFVTGKETKDTQAMKNFLYEVVGTVPFLGNLYGSYLYDNELIPIFSAPTQAIQELKKALTSKNANTRARGLAGFITTLMTLMGVPGMLQTGQLLRKAIPTAPETTPTMPGKLKSPFEQKGPGKMKSPFKHSGAFDMIKNLIKQQMS